MPIYEYECSQCGVFEVMQKMSDSPLKSCEKCGSSVSKKMSLTQFSLKGTGWYSTDYKKSSSASGSSAGSAACGTSGAEKGTCEKAACSPAPASEK